MSEQTRAGAVAEWFAAARDPRERPDPAVQVRTRRAVPAWSVRAAAAMALLLVGVVIADGVGTLVLTGVLAVAVLAAPQGPVPAVVVVAAVVHQVTRAPDAATLVGAPEMVRTAVVIGGLHLMAHLCRRAADLAPGAAIELAALRRGAIPAAAAQVVAQMCGLVAAGRLEEGTAWPAVAVLGIGLVCLVAAGRGMHRRDQAALAARRSGSTVQDSWTWSRLED
ncbi:hypothetical protein LQF12_05005 [Ruania suaedae]|uniref:hypothetical protein n=1 Tax=Ruania suaedae TaxID=2897774 RepID=UPI001E32BC6E|nr:hypothetical protein [Ruania suaedae]UFU03961.1 hypothetical protein LQF12_05005 [Ruania suaedae]